MRPILLATARLERAVRRGGCDDPNRGKEPQAMFLFFSNQLGCLPSLALSAAVTLVLLIATGIVEL